MKKVNGLLRRTRLAIQEFGPSMQMLMLPGGYLIALTGLISRHWPLEADGTYSKRLRTREAARKAAKLTAGDNAAGETTSAANFR
jgi:hypothetical protein